MDREEHEAYMTRHYRRLEDAEIERGEALFSAFQRAMQLHSENRNSHRDQGWRDAMIALANAFDEATKHVLRDEGFAMRSDLD